MVVWPARSCYTLCRGVGGVSWHNVAGQSDSRSFTAKTLLAYLGSRMNEEVMRSSRWVGLLTAVGFYTVAALVFLPQHVLANLAAAQPLSWGLVLLKVALPSYLWAALTPVIFRLARCFPVERPRIGRNLLIHFLLSILVSSAHGFASVSVFQLFYQQPSPFEYFRRNPATLATLITNGYGVYIGIAAFSHASAYLRKFRDREFRLQEAQLQVLRMQLNPHFLFNTLNAISALVKRSPRLATRTLAQLSDLLRLSLKGGETQEVMLKEELDFVRKYAELQRTLLQERLELDWDIDPTTLDAFVPSMILQPLVENSVRHGIAPLESGGRIEVSAARDGTRLRLRVCDTGQGLSGNGAPAALVGVGLANMRARLGHLYGEAQNIELRPTPGGGLTVEMVIPFREAAGW